MCLLLHSRACTLDGGNRSDATVIWPEACPQVARSPVACPPAARVPAAASATYDDDPLRDYERAVERERLSSMSIIELKTIARYKGIRVAGLLEKQELINAIVARHAS